MVTTETARTQYQETSQFWQGCDRLAEPFLQKIRSAIGPSDKMRSLNTFGNAYCAIDGVRYNIRKRKNGTGAYEFWSESLNHEISFFPRNGSLAPLKIEIVDYLNGYQDSTTEILFENGMVNSITQDSTKPQLLPDRKGVGQERINIQKEKDGSHKFTLGWEGQDFLISRGGKIELVFGESAGFVSIDLLQRNLTLTFDGKRFTLPLNFEDVVKKMLKKALRF